MADAALRALGVTVGFSDTIKKRDENKIDRKAQKLIDKAREEFDAYLESLGYESAMGMVIIKDR